jgi:hypothetical protein
MHCVRVRIAYFYKPNSLTLDGWRERMTLALDKFDRPIKKTYEEIVREGWVHLGTFNSKAVPTGVWRSAYCGSKLVSEIKAE